MKIISNRHLVNEMLLWFMGVCKSSWDLKTNRLQGSTILWVCLWLNAKYSIYSNILENNYVKGGFMVLSIWRLRLCLEFLAVSSNCIQMIFLSCISLDVWLLHGIGYNNAITIIVIAVEKVLEGFNRCLNPDD